MHGFKNFKGSDARCPSIHFLFYAHGLSNKTMLQKYQTSNKQQNHYNITYKQNSKLMVKQNSKLMVKQKFINDQTEI